MPCLNSLEVVVESSKRIDKFYGRDIDTIRMGKRMHHISMLKACAKTIKYSMTFETGRHCVGSNHVGVGVVDKASMKLFFPLFLLECMHCMHESRKSFIHSHAFVFEL